MNQRDPGTSSTDEPPVPGAALVLQRWNSWAKVWFPETDSTTWVNLAEVGFDCVAAAGSAPPRDDD